MAAYARHDTHSVNVVLGDSPGCLELLEVHCTELLSQRLLLLLEVKAGLG